MTRDRRIMALLFALVLGVTLVASLKQGVNRDEAYYMKAGEQYATYWEHVFRGQAKQPFSDGTIGRYWGYNHEHPPLLKLLYGVSWRLLHRCECDEHRGMHPGVAALAPGQKHRTLRALPEIAAFRLPTIAFFALLVVLVFAFAREALGLGVTGAVAAALLMAAQPRAFFHAQTSGFDLPAAALWFATIYCYWRALKGGRRGRWIAMGLVYGLFLATKLQSFFLPFAVGAHGAAVRIFDWWRRRDTPETRSARTTIVGLVHPWLPSLLLGFPVAIALWPWLWHKPWPRIKEYLGFHWTHVHYNFEYLGKNYNAPPYPWHEPIGMLATTAPVILLVLAAMGAVVLAKKWVRGDRDAEMTPLLVLVAAAVPVAPFLLGRTPIFGETKHWLATMPYLALCAGVAVDAVARAIAEEWKLERVPRALASAILVGVAAFPAIVETARSHPYGLSHYNALAGGAPGGADLGMNRQFWGYSVFGLFPWMNDVLPKNTKLYLHDWNHDSWEMYERGGLLRPDIVDAGMEFDRGIEKSDAALVIHELHFNKYDYMIWDSYGTLQPAEVLTLDGVPLVTIYRRPQKNK